jgi:hypothetical protein
MTAARDDRGVSSDEIAAWAELREAAAEILKFGQHEGPCTNDDHPDEPCETHLRHMDERKARLNRALEATSGPLPGTSWLSIGFGGTGPAVTRGAGPGGGGGSTRIAGSGGTGAIGSGCCGGGGRGD